MNQSVIDIMWVIVLSISPVLELRASIPYGILQTELSTLTIVTVAALANIAIAPVLFIFFNYVIHLFLRIKKIKKVWNHVILRAQKKVHPYLEKYGTLGLALFIAIPVPGSGVYTAALGAYILGYEFRKFFIATVIGVSAAAVIITAATLIGKQGLNFIMAP